MLFNFIFVFSQEKNKKKIEYINMSSFSILKNSESYYTNYSKDSLRTINGMGVDINTIHGVKLFGHISLSIGMSLDWNINKTFLSTPILYDVRFFSSKNLDNCFFAFLQTGQNIKWSSSFNGNGTTSKLGVGVIFKDSDSISYFVNIFKKSKQIELMNFKENGYYNSNGFGLSLGIIF